jgi:hypothetical protein
MITVSFNDVNMLSCEKGATETENKFERPKNLYTHNFRFIRKKPKTAVHVKIFTFAHEKSL